MNTSVNCLYKFGDVKWELSWKIETSIGIISNQKMETGEAGSKSVWQLIPRFKLTSYTSSLSPNIAASSLIRILSLMTWQLVSRSFVILRPQ